MDTKTTPRSNLVRNGPTTSSLKLRRRREGSSDDKASRKTQHRHSGDFMQWTTNKSQQPPQIIPVQPAFIVLGTDRFGLRQFPAEPSRRHPRQHQQLLLQQQQQHLQQQQQLLQQQQQQNQRRFAKSFHELLGGGDIDDVNCMETLDRKISPTDEELEAQDNVADWSHRNNSKPESNVRNSEQVVMRRRKPDVRSGKRNSGIETDVGDEMLATGGDRSKSRERQYRKSCDLSSYQMSHQQQQQQQQQQQPYHHPLPPQNLAVFGVRHDLYNNHVRFEMSQRPNVGLLRATASDFFVPTQKTKMVESEKVRERSTSRKGSRYPESEGKRSEVGGHHGGDDPNDRLEMSTTASSCCVTATGGETSLLQDSTTNSSETTIRKGVLWQQRDKVFSRWKERFFLLTPDYLQGFKKSTNQMTEMGRFIFKLKLTEIIAIELLDKRGYLTISLSLAKEGKILLRRPEGIKEWFQALKECIARCKERKGMMKTTKEFWSRKQFTDSSTIEQWISSKQQQQQSSNNINNDVESASVGDGMLAGVRRGVRIRRGNQTTDYGFIDAPPPQQQQQQQHHQQQQQQQQQQTKRVKDHHHSQFGKLDLENCESLPDPVSRAKTPSPYSSSKDTHSHDSGIGSIEKHGRSSPCHLDAVETRSETAKWRLRRQDEKAKEISVDDLINHFPSIWQMQELSTPTQVSMSGEKATSRTMARKSPTSTSTTTTRAPRTKSCHIESFLVHQANNQRPQITKL